MNELSTFKYEEQAKNYSILCLNEYLKFHKSWSISLQHNVDQKHHYYFTNNISQSQIYP